MSDSASCNMRPFSPLTGLLFCVVLFKLSIPRSNLVVVTSSPRPPGDFHPLGGPISCEVAEVPDCPLGALGTWENCRSWIVDALQYIVSTKNGDVYFREGERTGCVTCRLPRLLKPLFLPPPREWRNSMTRTNCIPSLIQHPRIPGGSNLFKCYKHPPQFLSNIFVPVP